MIWRWDGCRLIFWDLKLEKLRPKKTNQEIYEDHYGEKYKKIYKKIKNKGHHKYGSTSLLQAHPLPSPGIVYSFNLCAIMDK